MNRDDFKIGKWYKNLGSSKDYIGKFYGWNNNGKIMSVSEYIYFGQLRKHCDNFTKYFNYAELITDLSKIKKYLPKGHPDLINKIYEVW